MAPRRTKVIGSESLKLCPDSDHRRKAQGGFGIRWDEVTVRNAHRNNQRTDGKVSVGNATRLTCPGGGPCKPEPGISSRRTATPARPVSCPMAFAAPYADGFRRSGRFAHGCRGIRARRTTDQQDCFDLLYGRMDAFDATRVPWPKVTGLDSLVHSLETQGQSAKTTTRSNS